MVEECKWKKAKGKKNTVRGRHSDEEEMTIPYCFGASDKDARFARNHLVCDVFFLPFAFLLLPLFCLLRGLVDYRGSCLDGFGGARHLRFGFGPAAFLQSFAYARNGL